MFTDLKGFTSRTSGSSREVFMDLLDRYEEVVKPIFGVYGGQIVKEIGDAFMVIFESPTNAVLCGMRIQDEIYKYNQTVEEYDQLRMRVAISAGEVHVRNDDVFGDAVNIASRLESAAKIDDVYFTESVYYAMKKAEIPPILYAGAHKFKGIPSRVKVFKILGEYSRIKLRKKIKRNKIKRVVRFVLAAALVGVVMSLLFGSVGAFDAIAEYLNSTLV
jgi:class 3 adenylate cyclase